MVEWKNIGEVCKVHTGSQLNKADMLENGPYPVVNGGKEYSGYTDKYNENAYTITISQGGESAGYVNWLEVCFWAGAHCYVVENPEGYNTRYLYHTLKNKEREIQLSKQGAGIPGLNRDTLYKQVIPIPSLEEQARIVGILDTFTSAIDNLKEQIAQRRKQYEYYRDQLLNLEGKPGVEMKTIKDICSNICSGGTPSTSHKEYYEGSVNWLRTQEVDWKEIFDTEIRITEEAIANSSAKLIPENCIIVAMYGATAAKVAINKIPLTTNQACCNLEIDNGKALYKFVFHWLCKEYLNLKAMGEGSQNNINSQKVKGYPIPLPPLNEQQRIVSILDTFEASIQNLEAQLKQREKQYEYYRNKLLTFE